LVRRRRGASTLGCLFTMFIVAAGAYVGVKLGGAYWRAYQYEDAMRQQMRFLSNSPNETIISHLRASADTLGLPDEARKIAIRRTQGAIVVEAFYDEHIDLPMVSRDLHFHPHAEGTP
jgi:hypothetical protein